MEQLLIWPVICNCFQCYTECLYIKAAAFHLLQYSSCTSLPLLQHWTHARKSTDRGQNEASVGSNRDRSLSAPSSFRVGLAWQGSFLWEPRNKKLSVRKASPWNIPASLPLCRPPPWHTLHWMWYLSSGAHLLHRKCYEMRSWDWLLWCRIFYFVYVLYFMLGIRSFGDWCGIIFQSKLLSVSRTFSLMPCVCLTNLLYHAFR